MRKLTISSIACSIWEGDALTRMVEVEFIEEANDRGDNNVVVAAAGVSGTTSIASSSKALLT